MKLRFLKNHSKFCFSTILIFGSYYVSFPIDFKKSKDLKDQFLEKELGIKEIKLTTLRNNISDLSIYKNNDYFCCFVIDKDITEKDELFYRIKSLSSNLLNQYYISNIADKKSFSKSEYETINSILGTSDISELNDSLIVSSNGNLKIYKIKEASPLSISRFIFGIERINTRKELDSVLNRAHKETLILIIPPSQKIMSNIIKKFFYENSFLFSDFTFKFIQISEELKNDLKIDDDNFCFFMRKDNPITKYSKGKIKNNELEEYIIENNSLQKSKTFYFKKLNFLSNQEIYSGLLEKFGDFKDKEFLKSIINLEFDCCKKENQLMYEMVINEGFEKFTNFLKFVIDPLQNSEIKLVNLEFLKRNIYFTKNSDLAAYYKFRFFEERKKVLFIYIKKDLIKISRDQNYSNKIDDYVYSIVDESIRSLSAEEIKDFRIIITHNNKYNIAFSIIPDPKEEITIRYFDYSKVAFFEKNKLIIKNYEFLEKLSKNERENVFSLKYKYEYEFLNRKNLVEFLQKSLKNKNSPYLEHEASFEADYQLENTILPISSVDLEKNVFKKKGKKVILIVDHQSPGCENAKHFLSDKLKNNVDSNAQYFIYNKYNESLFSKKVKKVPYLIVLEGGQITNEIDMSDLLSKNSLNSSLDDILYKEFKV